MGNETSSERGADEKDPAVDFDLDEYLEQHDKVEDVDSTQDGNDPSGVRQLLLSISSAAKRKHFERQTAFLEQVLQITRAEVQKEAPVSIGLYPVELAAALNDSVCTAQENILVIIANLALYLSPLALNSSFGYLRAHTEQVTIFKNKSVIAKGDEYSLEGDVHAGNAHFRILSATASDSIGNNLSYLLLETNPMLVRYAVLILSVLFLHPENRKLSHEPRGLVFSLQSDDVLTKYFAISALGNLCLVCNEVLGEITSFTSSARQLLFDGLREIVLIIANPATPVFVLEACFRALVMMAGTNDYRSKIAQELVKITWRVGRTAKRPTRRNRSSSLYTQSETGEPSYKFLHVLFYGLRLPHFLLDSQEEYAFEHIAKACKESDLLYEICCILMVELSACPQNEELFDELFCLHTTSSTRESECLTYHEVLFIVFDEQKEKYRPSSVSLSMSVLNICRETEKWNIYADSYDVGALVVPFEKMFSRQRENGFDYHWASFSTSTESWSSRSQLLCFDLLEHGRSGVFSWPIAPHMRIQDRGFDEHWISFFHVIICTGLENLLARNCGEMLPTAMVQLTALCLNSCFDSGIFIRMLKIVTDLALRSDMMANELCRRGVVETLVQVLWVLLEDQGLMVLSIEVYNKNDYDRAPLFKPVETRQSEPNKTSRHGDITDIHWITLENILLVEDSFMFRLRHLMRSIGPGLLIPILKCVSTFSIYDSLRPAMRDEYRLMILSRKMLLMLENEAVQISKNDGHIPQIPVGQMVFLKTQLAILIGNLAPVNHVLTPQAWLDGPVWDPITLLIQASLADNDDSSTMDSHGDLFCEVDCYQRYKSSCALEVLTRSFGSKLVFVYFTELLTLVGSLLGQNSKGVDMVRTMETYMGLRILSNLTSVPNGIQLWLKFESRRRMCVDSAGHYLPVFGRTFRIHALSKRVSSSPQIENDTEQLLCYHSLKFTQSAIEQKLKVLKAGPFAHFAEQQRGLQRKSQPCCKPVGTEYWGVNFAGDDFIVLHEKGIPLGKEWTVSVWFLVNVADDTNDFNHDCYTLIQSSDGDAQIAILRRALVGAGLDQSGEYPTREEFIYELGAFCAATKTWYGTGFDLYKLVPGWHHLLVVGQNGKTVFHIDGDKSMAAASIDYQCTSNILVLGNSIQKDQPWGTLADFRLFDIAMSRNSEDWDLFLDGRTWGLHALPPATEFSLSKLNRNKELTRKRKIAPTHVWKKVKDIPWIHRPPDFVRAAVARFEDSVLVHRLFEILSSDIDDTECRILAALVMGDIALCAQLRNLVIAADTQSFFTSQLSKSVTPDEGTDSPKQKSQEDLRFALSRLLYHVS
mmetsp:Transcript_33289/g.53681  ORF Transcript_33289/g.53681 Transcript_33289/m.53681 type:complete len:1327 (+) Transcript_33289:200-4180(+)|eukprot:CAMPEP_0203747808 /NCGR_PEP_ID=MMETSP0098-20131031/2860_1 /ASSEMBLY_ACC=CAM_ASM_000208 /TAXON_ID=96639 /ORGANISM=" , Strain NY0313808BC1" /LENGTH=1326 /DNA_ID=CAMNT_0050636361 /DNA_START=173 /DNA_END=4153 /DNA_ORIENTATION=-